MRMLFLKAGAIAVLLGSIPFANAQNATEMFIPIGQSPGLSHKQTYIGKIEGIDVQERTITVADGHTVKITEKTRIWLDRTQLKVTNQTGRFSDLREGRKLEIKYHDPDHKKFADWIKVEIE